MDLIKLLQKDLEVVSDPRVQGRTSHVLLEIIVLTVVAYICGAETWTDIESFGNSKKLWLRKYLKLKNGIPSHDTIARVFSLIEPKELEIAFIEWTDKVRSKNAFKDVIGIDGKVVRGTYKRTANGAKILNIVNAYSTQSGLVLGQTKAAGRGSSEVGSALCLLDSLNIKDTVIVCDAGIGHTSFAKKVISKNGDYIFPIKRNHRHLHQEISDIFTNLKKKKIKAEKHVVKEHGHGRDETRTYRIIRTPELLESINKTQTGNESYPSLAIIGEVEYIRVSKEDRAPILTKFIDASGHETNKYVAATGKFKIKTETRYFISSLSCDIKQIAEYLRKQWGIENQLHWSLDVNLNEDGNRTRNHIAATNASVVRKIVYNLGKNEDSKKIGLKRKLKKASWDDSYLETLLFGKKLDIT